MSEQHDLAEHVGRNRAAWDRLAGDYAEPGRRAWQSEPSWGMWGIPETEVQLLPDVTGRDVMNIPPLAIHAAPDGEKGR